MKVIAKKQKTTKKANKYIYNPQQIIYIPSPQHKSNSKIPKSPSTYIILKDILITFNNIYFKI